MQVRGELKTFDRVGKTLTINTFFMNKVKMFFVAAALVLTTAGVFAGKKFTAISNLWFYNQSTSSYVRVSSGAISGGTLTLQQDPTVTTGATASYNGVTYDFVTQITPSTYRVVYFQ